MGKGKKKSNKRGGEPWRSKVKRMEQIYGALRIPIWEKYSNLKEVISIANNASSFLPRRSNNDGFGLMLHPFEREIKEFQLPPNYQDICSRKLATAPSVMRKTDSGNKDYSVVWISTVNQLDSLIEQLKNLDHLFMDIEGHNVRSFRGITSLLQIFDDVHRTVYFIDTLALYTEMERFHPIFTDPKIVKVMHGSHNDIKSFEKDFSLYIVGLVDTQMVYREFHKQFGKTGNFQDIPFEPSNISYKAIVQGFLPNVDMEKSETFTDFRQRPLHPAQRQYAFLDVWYLPYVYFAMVTKLDSNRLSSAVELSRKICFEQRFSFSLVNLDKRTDESDVLWQLRRLRYYIALKEDINPEYLCSAAVLEKIRFGGKSVVDAVFFKYPLALETALRGGDGVKVLETEYSDLSIPFPYNPPRVSELLFCCKHWKLTDHRTKDCKLTKDEVKVIKKRHYETNPDKKKNRLDAIHKREKTTVERRKKRNKRNMESKKRNLPEGFVQRRARWFQRQRTANEIRERQLLRGIALGNRRQQVDMLRRQQYRERVNVFLRNHQLN